MTKTQKVKFHKGDRRPNDEQPKLSYTKKMVMQYCQLNVRCPNFRNAN